LAEGRGGSILAGLLTSICVNINSSHHRLRISLCHHQGNKSRTRADIEYALSSPRPCAEQGSVGAHLHSTAVVIDGKLAKSEIRIRHLPAKLIKKKQMADLSSVIWRIFRSICLNAQVTHARKNPNKFGFLLA
jgi:hypothetical protein